MSKKLVSTLADGSVVTTLKIDRMAVSIVHLCLGQDREVPVSWFPLSEVGSLEQAHANVVEVWS